MRKLDFVKTMFLTIHFSVSELIVGDKNVKVYTNLFAIVGEKAGKSAVALEGM